MPMSTASALGTLNAARSRPIALAAWLTIVAALVVLIVVVGGITRLTESGLSITDWKPVTGVLPPLNEADWRTEYAAYRETREFIEESGPAGMTLAKYKTIFFWEWFHRVIGRIIGIAFAIPLAWFWWKDAIPAGYKPRLLALLALGAAQGVFGWLMVSSGLGEDAGTDVSHYWLSIHLMTAFVTLGGLTWTALDLRGEARGDLPAGLRPLALLALAVLAIQMLYGAWMAGLNAGPVAGGGLLNSWPLMQGSLFPEGIDWSQGTVHALTADPFMVHFIHRWWAFAALGALIMLARRLKRIARRGPAIAINAVAGTQVLLGIATVWTGVPIAVAALHQFVGAILVIVAVWGAHALWRPDRMPGSLLR